MGTRATWLRLSLLWVAGANLRVTMLSVPPLLPEIHRSLNLDERAVGALNGIPLLLLALASIPGALLIARLGARRAMVLGLGVVALAGALRSAAPAAPALLGATVVMGAGIAVCQPALPALVRHWLPARTGLATATFSNGLLIGEIAGASLTAPLLLTLVSGWRPALAVWSIPVAAGAAAIVLLTGPEPRDDRGLPATPRPRWRGRGILLLGGVLGCSSVGYFAANAFLPDYLRAQHESWLIPLALTAINVAQLPASIAVAARPSLLVGRRAPLVVAGALMAGAALGLALAGQGWIVLAWSALIGFSAAGVFVLILALPAALPTPRDAAQASAAIFTVSYACAFAGPIIAGALWDISHVPAAAFVPVAAAGAVIALGSLGIEIGEVRPAAAGG